MAINLRKEAKGQQCCVRLPGICNGNNETVVLAHLNNKRLFGMGIGQKVPDMFGSRCCSACHDVIDGRTRPPLDEDGCCYTRDEIKIMFYEGVFRTQNILLKEGKI